MDKYHIALFIHLLALVTASCAAALVSFAQARFARATTPGEALEWLKFTGSAAKAFPIAVVTLLLTGGFMVSAGGVWSWSAGFVQAGVTGAVLLFASGAIIGKRSRGVGAAVAQLLQRGSTAADLRSCIDPVVGTMIAMNHGIALGVVFVMTLKPTPVVSFGALLAFVVASIGLHHVRAAKPVGNPVAETAKR